MTCGRLTQAAAGSSSTVTWAPETALGTLALKVFSHPVHTRTHAHTHTRTHAHTGFGNATTIPSARRLCNSWMDSRGTFWLFGGFGHLYNSAATGTPRPLSTHTHTHTR